MVWPRLYGSLNLRHASLTKNSLDGTPIGVYPHSVDLQREERSSAEQSFQAGAIETCDYAPISQLESISTSPYFNACDSAYIKTYFSVG